MTRVLVIPRWVFLGGRGTKCFQAVCSYWRDLRRTWPICENVYCRRRLLSIAAMSVSAEFAWRNKGRSEQILGHGLLLLNESIVQMKLKNDDEYRVWFDCHVLPTWWQWLDLGGATCQELSLNVAPKIVAKLATKAPIEADWKWFLFPCVEVVSLDPRDLQRVNVGRCNEI